MKRSPFLVCMACLLILALAGIAPAAGELSANATTAVTTTTTTAVTESPAETPGITGGSVFFETDPAGATVWVDGRQIGTSDTTYYSEKAGKLNVFIQRKDYENFTGSVTVIEGKKVEFYAKLVPLQLGVPATEPTPPPTLVTVTTIRRSTLTIPTSWPETTQSPVDPAAAALAAGAGLALCAIRRR